MFGITIEMHVHLSIIIDLTMKNTLYVYRKGISIRQAPVFRHLRALRKTHGGLLSG